MLCTPLKKNWSKLNAKISFLSQGSSFSFLLENTNIATWDISIDFKWVFVVIACLYYTSFYESDT